jgi:LCP family protein required for cell wall assembly
MRNVANAKRQGKRPRSRRRRWARRAGIAGGVVVVLAVALGLGGYFYVGYQFNRIHKVHVGGEKPAKPGAPFTVLVAGSDSRSFVSTPGQCKSFGCGADVGGARSDVIILVRVVPAERKIEMLSIPRDTWVTIPGNVEYISGQNRINAAFNTGSPSLLVATILQNFHIPINHFVEVNFLGLQNMVNAIGGVHLDFKYPLRDRELVNGVNHNMTGLRILKTGCQLVTGTQALALVRSRNIQYEVKGVWYDDYGSDFTRIRNQQTFFRAVIHQLNHEITNPFALNDFINSAVHDLTIDDTLTEGTLVKLAGEFHSFPPGSLETVTMPTVGPYITSGGADVLLPAAAADETVIKNFLAFGTAKTSPASSTTTTSRSSSSTTTVGPTSSTTSTSSPSTTSTTSTTTTSTTTTEPKTTTVTTIAPTPAGETPIYNNTVAPYDPMTC